FSMAATSLVAASASAAPAIFTLTRAGMHSTFALTLASQLAEHSALISGGFSSPEHLGASILTSQPPEQVPLQSALPLTVQDALQLPPQVPEQVPSAFASHLPSHLPAQAAPLL